MRGRQRGTAGSFRWLSRCVAAVLATGVAGCILPVQRGPAVSGVVVDAETGEPLAGALVVVRYDAHTGGGLPDRERMGHVEVTTDAAGHFRAGPMTRLGVAPWPLFEVEPRVVSVLSDGYLCPEPVRAHPERPVRIELDRVTSVGDLRAACRPVAARSGEAEAYMQAWRTLFPDERGPDEFETDRALDRLLAARANLGFGRNCKGPVIDLALEPGGRRAAYLVGSRPGAATPGSAGFDVRVARLDPAAGEPLRLARVEPEGDRPGAGPGRLAWSGPGELLLWEPASDLARAISPTIFAAERLRQVWTVADADHPAPPAAPSFGQGSRTPRHPVDVEDLNDEADSRWLGRSFGLGRSLDPETGLARDELRIARLDGGRETLALPGEACGPEGRFGRPHYRIAADGSTAVDLRYVDGGCHVVRIDLDSGDWARVDRAEGRATCDDVRNVPAASLGVALRGYEREIRSAVASAGGDPEASYTIRIAQDGSTWAVSRSFSGEPVSVAVPPFPLQTPLRRIDVSVVGQVRSKPSGPIEVRALEPL